MKAQFTVTIEGKWWHNGKPATAAIVERELRKAVKDRFDYLASRMTVRKVKQADLARTQADAGKDRPLPPREKQ